jgi:tRNA-binding protein
MAERAHGMGEVRGSSPLGSTFMATYEDFQKIDIRVGKIIEIEDFPEAKKPSYKLKIDFGQEVGIKVSSAQLVRHYTKEQLRGKLILGVINFPPRQIGPFMSEVLTLGIPDKENYCVLIVPDGKEAIIGGRLY